MKIIKIDTKIEKWSKSNDNYIGHLMETDKPEFALVNTPAIKMLKIIDNIYHTNIDTDFILDIDINTLLVFESDKAITTKDLYELYVAAKNGENEEILKSNEAGLTEIWFRLHIDREIYKRSFEALEDDLKRVLKEFPDTTSN